MKVNNKRWRYIIHNTKNGRIELEWAIKSGPIKVNQTKDGKCLDPVFFKEHSVESMQTAFDYIRKIILND